LSKYIVYDLTLEKNHLQWNRLYFKNMLYKIFDYISIGILENFIHFYFRVILYFKCIKICLLFKEQYIFDIN